jgi:hypothetical protein
MKTKPSRETKPYSLRVRIPAAVESWLRRAAKNAHVDMSDIVRPLLMAAYEGRHK